MLSLDSLPDLPLAFFTSFLLKTEFPCVWGHMLFTFFAYRSYGASCIGKTVRRLHTRVSERMGISPLTGKKRSNPPLKHSLSHHQNANHPVSFEDFKILSCSSFEYELLLHESLLISKLKRSFNADTGLAPLLLL